LRPAQIVLCFGFYSLRLVHSMLPVFLDCSFWLPFRYSPTFIFISRYWGDRLHKLIAFVFSLFLILD
jgi:hypothetical protein